MGSFIPFNWIANNWWISTSSTLIFTALFCTNTVHLTRWTLVSLSHVKFLLKLEISIFHIGCKYLFHFMNFIHEKVRFVNLLNIMFARNCMKLYKVNFIYKRTSFRSPREHVDWINTAKKSEHLTIISLQK